MAALPPVAGWLCGVATGKGNVEEVAAHDFLAAEGHGWREATGRGLLQGVCMAGSASRMPTVAANGSHPG